MAKRNPSPKDLLEAQVAKQLRDFLELRRWRRVRHQRTVVPGQFQTGEPGMADEQWIYYLQPHHSGLTVTQWIETKRSKRGKRSEDQDTWQAREIARGAVVINCNDIDAYMKEYEIRFGWLHSGKHAQPGHQTRLGLEAAN
jgi:hypothetical protein